MTKLAVITGASEGLGRTFAQQLAAKGYRTISIARNEQRLGQLVAELDKQSAEKHQYHVADLSTEEGIGSCVELLGREHVDVFINNAGFSQFAVFSESPRELQEKILNVNTRALLVLAHAFLAQAKRGDALVNLSSITNTLTTPVQPVYCATKCFAASLSESLWYQERKRGVYVQALLPGVTKTKFMERSSDIEGFKMKLLDFISQTPEAVVKTSLRAVDKRSRPIVIPGISNNILVALLKLVPRKWLVWSMGRVSDLA